MKGEKIPFLIAIFLVLCCFVFAASGLYFAANQSVFLFPPPRNMSTSTPTIFIIVPGLRVLPTRTPTPTHTLDLRRIQTLAPYLHTPTYTLDLRRVQTLAPHLRTPTP